MKYNKEIIIKTNKNLCSYDIISYNIQEGQQLLIKKEIGDKEYKVEIISNKSKEDLSSEYINGVTCFKLFSIVRNTDDPNYCMNNTREFTINSIRNDRR